MRAHTSTARPRRKARSVILALALTVCALAIPASANAQPIDSGPSELSDTGYSSVNAISGDSSDSGQPGGGSDYSSLNSIAPPTTPGGSGASQDVSPGYSSLNAISGPPTEAPTLVSTSSGGSGEGFDWPSALVGAGVALALAALGSAALLTVRRRSAISPTASTS
jgi:hypothetical protein